MYYLFYRCNIYFHSGLSLFVVRGQLENGKKLCLVLGCQGFTAVYFPGTCLSRAAVAESRATVSFHNWAVFSVFICPAVTLPLDRPFLDDVLQSNVTLCCCMGLLL